MRRRGVHPPENDRDARQSLTSNSSEVQIRTILKAHSKAFGAIEERIIKALLAHHSGNRSGSADLSSALEAQISQLRVLHRSIASVASSPGAGSRAHELTLRSVRLSQTAAQQLRDSQAVNDPHQLAHMLNDVKAVAAQADTAWRQALQLLNRA